MKNFGLGREALAKLSTRGALYLPRHGVAQHRGPGRLEPSALGHEVFHSRVWSRRLARPLNQHMRTGKLYPTPTCMEPFLREQFRGQVAELAAAGIYVGTPSWKYEDWLGT
jgi:hypothetical protein